MKRREKGDGLINITHCAALEYVSSYDKKILPYTYDNTYLSY